MAACLPKQHLEQQKLLEQLNETDEEEEDAADALRPSAQMEEENFAFPNINACWVCNGYYGPNFDEPLCGTCHSFLYNTQAVNELETAISDDEDSGNDEPPFKDKQEVDDDDEEDDNDDDADGIVDALDVEVDDEEGVELVAQAEPLVGENAAENAAVAMVYRSPERDVANPLLGIQRPRPSAPRSLPQYMELLSDGRANAQETRNPVQKNSITAMPVEIMVKIFSYLDDMSMWRVTEVSKHWHNIIELNTSQLMWKKYFKERWPLFQSIVDVPNWLKLYSALMSSCFCRICLLQMALKSPPRTRNNAIRMNLLRNDFRLLNSCVTEGIEAVPLDKQNTYWQASILGPAGSPYEGGKFFLFIFFPEGYPMTPPTLRFLTKILHPNVSRHGDVGIDIFQHNWSLALNVSKVLLSVQSLLTDPYTEVCMEPEIGHMYEHNRTRFEKLARSWTWKYAMFELIPPK